MLRPQRRAKTLPARRKRKKEMIFIFFSQNVAIFCFLHDSVLYTHVHTAAIQAYCQHICLSGAIMLFSLSTVRAIRRTSTLLTYHPQHGDYSTTTDVKSHYVQDKTTTTTRSSSLAQG